MESEKVPEDNLVPIVCPHCNKDFKVENIVEVECSDCGSTTISILTKRCKNPDCQNIYCRDCLENLNDNDFCDECETILCDGCEEEVERGTHTSCAKCENADFCLNCAPAMTDSELGCVECVSSELIVECSGSSCCSNPILKSKAILCKNFDDCEAAFCKDCAKENLDEQGYCEDCNSFECSHCENRFHISDGLKCSNMKCKYEEVFCKKCSKFSLDSVGACLKCSTESTSTCVDCQNKTLTNQATKCSNCARSVCPSCSQTMLECTQCHKKVCGHCGKRCKTCQKAFCNKCTMFDSSGRCQDHKKKNIFVRILDAIQGN